MMNINLTLIRAFGSIKLFLARAQKSILFNFRLN